ncbi:hypothetical protein CDAR_219631 [Caerostris darwini]|uniref:Uncharacterized protein n=1 Tax=Caerostris darwini TaxID=1538125 RepID=A0AAV4THS9_9ARAC|nr:hypothetical protein CDAR_219631 [Caerostris darwini]
MYLDQKIPLFSLTFVPFWLWDIHWRRWGDLLFQIVAPVCRLCFSLHPVAMTTTHLPSRAVSRVSLFGAATFSINTFAMFDHMGSGKFRLP